MLAEFSLIKDKTNLSELVNYYFSKNVKKRFCNIDRGIIINWLKWGGGVGGESLQLVKSNINLEGSSKQNIFSQKICPIPPMSRIGPTQQKN